MKKKGKTKRVITICITVIMMLCVFIVPSNAATYQPVNNYNIIQTETTEINSYETNESVAYTIKNDIDLIIQKIYNVTEINTGDIFEYETEKSIIKWNYEGNTYTSTRAEKIKEPTKEGYYFYANNSAGENNVLYVGRTTGYEGIIQISNEDKNPMLNFLSGRIEYAESENIEIVTPPSFIGHATTGMKTVLGWVAMPFNALINGGWNSLLVLFTIGIAISGVLIAVKIIRKFIWGD